MQWKIIGETAHNISVRVQWTRGDDATSSTIDRYSNRKSTSERQTQLRPSQNEENRPAPCVGRCVKLTCGPCPAARENNGDAEKRAGQRGLQFERIGYAFRSKASGGPLERESGGLNNRKKINTARTLQGLVQNQSFRGVTKPSLYMPFGTFLSLPLWCA